MEKLLLVFYLLVLTGTDKGYSQAKSNDITYVEYKKSSGLSYIQTVQLWFTKETALSKFKENSSIREWPAFNGKKYASLEDSLVDQEIINDLDSKMSDKSLNKTVYFKNVKDPFYIRTNFDGKGTKYCISDTVPIIQWELLSDTTILLGFNCQKANFTFKSGQKGYAWFVPNIPVPFGPEKVGGLPGLILKIGSYDGNYKVEASAIKYPYNEQIVIAPCTGGINITDKKLTEHLNKQNEEMFKMMDSFKQRRDNN